MAKLIASEDEFLILLIKEGRYKTNRYLSVWLGGYYIRHNPTGRWYSLNVELGHIKRYKIKAHTTALENILTTDLQENERKTTCHSS
jgi:hypothetical protein